MVKFAFFLKWSNLNFFEWSNLHFLNGQISTFFLMVKFTLRYVRAARKKKMRENWASNMGLVLEYVRFWKKYFPVGF